MSPEELLTSALASLCGIFCCVACLPILLLPIWAYVVCWVASDCKYRGVSSTKWVILCLATGLLGLGLYLLDRRRD